VLARLGVHFPPAHGDCQFCGGNRLIVLNNNSASNNSGTSNLVAWVASDTTEVRSWIKTTLLR
jgi:hypothetical protein